MQAAATGHEINRYFADYKTAKSICMRLFLLEIRLEHRLAFAVLSVVRDSASRAVDDLQPTRGTLVAGNPREYIAAEWAQLNPGASTAA